jgi:hypothetical protein
MSYDEMRQTWKEQRARTMGPGEATGWIARTRLAQVKNKLSMAFSVAVSFGIFFLKLVLIAYDSERTITNSYMELFVFGAVCLAASYGLRHYVRKRREFDFLGDDPIHCLDALIKTSRSEINEIRRGVPAVFLGALVLIALSQWQNVVMGFVSPAIAWCIVGLTVSMFTIAGAFFYHRLDAFLKPRLESLEATRKTFA